MRLILNKQAAAITTAILSAFMLLLLSGCTYSSGEKVFFQTEPVESKPTAQAEERLRTALETLHTSEEAQKFWFSGYVANDLNKRRTTSMFNGVVVQPHGYTVDVRLAGQPYQYYKWDDHRFIFTEKKGWYRVTEEKLPFDPWMGFTWWEPFLDRAKQLPNEEILSNDCEVYQIRTNGAEWIKKSGSPLFADLHALMKDTPGIEPLLEQTDVTMTLWIGAEDNLIYQYQTLIKMPLPAAGYTDQEIKFRFYHYGDPGIKVKTPEEMEKYLPKNEE